MKTLLEIFPNWKQQNDNTNIFNAILNIKKEDSLKWLTNETVDQYNLLYFAQYSGLKYCSGFVNLIRKGDVLTADEAELIAKAILTRYETKWNKLYEVVLTQYDPIVNEITDKFTHGKIETFTPGVTDTRTLKVTSDITVVNQDDTLNSKYGFNSTEAFPQATGVVKNKQTTSGDGEKNKSVDEMKHTGADTRANTGDDIRKITNTAFDNVQTALQEEIKLWNNFNFTTILFNDIDNILTIGVY